MSEQTPHHGDGPAPERVSLDVGDPATQRKRARSGAAGTLLVAAAIGGITGLLAGRLPGLITAAAISLPLLFVVWSQGRRTVWLEGTHVVARSVGLRRVDLTRAARLELILTSVRGVRTISLLVAGPPSGKRVTISLALYAGTGGRELGVLALRRLANTLANNMDAGGMVFAELLVAQLRAEARGDAAADRPLYRIAAAVSEGRTVQRVTMEAVSRFVANLEEP